MLTRDYLIAGIDVSLCLVIVFALGFLAVRYDQVRMEEAVSSSLQVVGVAGEGDFSSMAYLAIILDEEEAWAQEFRGGDWLPRESNWRSALTNSALPIVIYDLANNASLAEIVRAAVAAGRPVAITREAE